MKIYKKQYLFYLEKRDEKNDIGPLLKFGRKGKPVAHIIDLSARPVDQTDGLNGILVVKTSDKDSKFKIITQEVTLKLKAENPTERDSWIQVLVQET